MKNPLPPVPSRPCLAVRRSLLAAAALAAGLPPALWAQEPESAAGVADEASSRVKFLGEAGVVFQPETDIDGPGDGAFEVVRYDAGVLLSTDLTDRLRWGNTLFAGISDYEFDGGGFAAGDPWDTTVLLRYGTSFGYRLNETWGVRAGGVFMYSRETDADWSTSFTGGGTVGVDYRVNNRLFLTAGLGVTSQIEDSEQLVPAIGFVWEATDDWTVRVGALPVSGGALAGGEVEYRFNEPLALGLGVQFNQRRFRLDDEGIAPDGVGHDQSIPVRLRLGWNINPAVSLHLLTGVAVGGELELADRDGVVLRNEDYDPALYFGLRFLGRF
ncbi:MAG: hypothetical protein ACKVYV_12110 [Limisphaerales bacterium]